VLSFQFFLFRKRQRSEREGEESKKVQAHSFVSTIEMGANFKTLLENVFKDVEGVVLE
jgi:hypothetical protein